MQVSLLIPSSSRYFRASRILMSVGMGISLVFMTALTSCKKAQNALNAASTANTDSRFLYVASGACYGGGVTTSSGAGTIVRYNLATDAKEIVTDYTTVGLDLPVGVADWDSDNLLVAVEIAGARRLEIVNKRGLGRYTIQSNATALSSQLRSVTRLADGGFLVSKTASVERFNSTGGRSALAPYINTPAGTCATSTTLISATAELGNGKLVFAHAAATPNNKFGIISASGYSAASDCLAAQAAPITTALPSAMVYLPDLQQLLVGYGSGTAGSNQVWSYAINESTAAITGATAAYTNFNVVNGPSAMAYDQTTGRIYIANSLGTLNTIEKFSYDSSSKMLTRVGTTPFIPPSISTRCISGMSVGN